ncbi:VOC family protein [Saccharomonospora sp. NB11]|jgi:catechol 2,3-dioxygenase-like lactoylglutathione lyase family enzyme|uniref:VOC family protein n=1 Tax=Saccharomonospora sp. NB11 TaxID=1642298 RepID=UPI0018D1169F|nr:VOC family protein [Saccharomonospora sp. NB11]
MSAHVIAVVVDCADAEALAEFWRKALDYAEPRRWRDADGLTYVQLDGDPALLFQPVGEPKTVKNRWHLDLAARGSQADEVERLVGLGARVIDEAPRQPWVVLADPEGNEFCVLPPR